MSSKQPALTDGCKRFDAGGIPTAAGDGTYLCGGCGRTSLDVATRGHAPPEVTAERLGTTEELINGG